MKKILFVLTALILSCTAIAAPVQLEPVENASETAYADSSVSEALLYAEYEGEGTIDSPYIISNASQLLGIAPVVNTASGAELYFSLEADIDLDGAEWTPIGTSSNPFNGAFYGNGYSVSNFKITEGRTDNGFFGYVKQADITNLSLSNVTLQYTYTGSTTTYAGILAGRLCKESTGTDVVNSISEISATGIIDISSKNTASYTGGLIGYVSSKSGNYEITDCLSLSDISLVSDNSRKVYVGGIVSKLEDNISKFTLTLKNAYYNGNINITSKGDVTCGGIAGEVFSAGSGWVSGWYGSLMDDYSESNVDKCMTNGSISIDTTGSINVGYVSGSLNSETTQNKCARISVQSISAKKNGVEYTKYNNPPETVKPENLGHHAINTLEFDTSKWDLSKEVPSFGTTDTCTINFRANGGKNSPGTQLKIKGTGFELPSATPTRVGYNLVGWSKKSTGEAQYAAGSIFTGDTNATLYAIWELKTYTISYIANGGDNAPADQPKTHFQEIVLSSDVPTRTGYSFLGWSTSAEGDVKYASGAKFTTEADTTLYAVWKPDEYAITFNANGGENAPANQTKLHDITLTITSDIPSKTGYSFLGWSTSAEGDVEYTSGSDFTANAATTLYAVWTILKGDINADGEFNQTDITLLADFLLGKADTLTTDEHFSRANVYETETDSDTDLASNLNIKDLIKLAQLASNN